jgi:hypothetical protein
MTTGLLGDNEALAVCYDDGDVVAYYTKEIADRISQILDGPGAAVGGVKNLDVPAFGTKPRPFLHENIGNSAWGLAIHAQSRLIAASSNHHEITVFVPAITREEDASASPHGSCECDQCCHSVVDRLRRRVRNWRIIVALGPDADNIPNVAFMDDENGEAEKVCAVDINGVVWLAHIWEPLKLPMRIPGYRSLPSEEFFHDSSR